MSADNGVYIPVSWRHKGKKEYRVVHTQAIEIIWYKPDYPRTAPVFNFEYLVAQFGQAPVLTDRKIAEGYAIRELYEVGKDGYQCEYGIVWLEYQTIQFPPCAANVRICKADNGSVTLSA